MHISQKYKTIFVHNQKTGGVSIRSYLEKHLEDVEYILPNHAYAMDGIEKIEREAWDSYYSFGFVRNPWSRLVSWYTMITTTPIDTPTPKKVHLDNKLWNHVKENSNSFEEFLYNCTDTIVETRNGFDYKKSFVKNQIDYFTDKEGEVAVNHIGKLESLEEDFERIKTEAGLPNKPLPRSNVGKSVNYREFYTDVTRELVRERFKKDIEYFGYTFDDK